MNVHERVNVLREEIIVMATNYLAAGWWMAMFFGSELKEKRKRKERNKREDSLPHTKRCKQELMHLLHFLFRDLIKWLKWWKNAFALGSSRMHVVDDEEEEDDDDGDGWLWSLCRRRRWAVKATCNWQEESSWIRWKHWRTRTHASNSACERTSTLTHLHLQV